MALCDKCHNLYDITRSVKQAQIGGNVQQVQKKINNIIDTFLIGDEITPELIKNIPVDLLLQQQKFSDLKKKDQQKLLKQIEEINGDTTSEDENTTSDEDEVATKKHSCFFICNNCGYNKPMPDGTVIYTKNYGVSNYDKLENYELLINDNTLPRTTIYDCPNKSCPSIKNKNLHEAVITHNSLYQVIYVCCACKTYWQQS
jgi:polyhydroxyalkanoate synthesis regulator phasin